MSSDDSDDSSQYDHSIPSDLSKNSKHGQLSPGSNKFPSPSSSTRSASIARSVSTGRVLPCEFVGFAACDASFEIDELVQWFVHIVDTHLHWKYPAHCICWFCDKCEFIANPKSRTRGLRQSFQARMQHIHWHFTNENVGVNDIRIDCYFLEHLHKNMLIPQFVYDDACAWSEAPKIGGIYPPPPIFVPDEVRMRQMRQMRQRRREPIIQIHTNQEYRKHVSLKLKRLSIIIKSRGHSRAPSNHIAGEPRALIQGESAQSKKSTTRSPNRSMKGESETLQTNSRELSMNLGWLGRKTHNLSCFLSGFLCRLRWPRISLGDVRVEWICVSLPFSFL